jgi:hypothetical protein
MSQEAKDRIESAISDLAMTEIADPNQALADAVKSAGIPPGHVPLLAQAYNVGQATRRRLECETQAEKAAAFPTADPEAIRRLVYADIDQPANQPLDKSAQTALLDYVGVPSWYYRRAAALAEKADSSLSKAAKTTVPPRELNRDLYGEHMKLCAGLEKAASLTRRLADRERDDAICYITTLRTALHDPALPPVERIAKYAAQICGPGAGEVVKQLSVGRMPAKSASVVGPHRVNAGVSPYREIAQFIDHGKHAFVFDLAADYFADLAIEGRQLFELATTNSKRNLTADELIKASSGVAPVRSFVDNSLRLGTAGNLFASLGDRVRAKHEDAEQDVMGRLVSPSHENELRSIGAQSMLQDFLSNDPIIAAHDPHTVADKFNRISQFAPRVASEPLMMEALLRRSLQGPTDPFEVSQIAQTEKTIGETKRQKPRGGAPEDSNVR